MSTDKIKTENSAIDSTGHPAGDAAGDAGVDAGGDAANEAPNDVANGGPDAMREVNGPKGPEPTRYGDWEQKGRCSDF